MHKLVLLSAVVVVVALVAERRGRLVARRAPLHSGVEFSA
jgi:hypothetical protein